MFEVIKRKINLIDVLSIRRSPGLVFNLFKCDIILDFMEQTSGTEWFLQVKSYILSLVLGGRVTASFSREAEKITGWQVCEDWNVHFSHTWEEHTYQAHTVPFHWLTWFWLSVRTTSEHLVSTKKRGLTYNPYLWTNRMPGLTCG